MFAPIGSSSPNVAYFCARRLGALVVPRHRNAIMPARAAQSLLGGIGAPCESDSNVQRVARGSQRLLVR